MVRPCAIVGSAQMISQGFRRTRGNLGVEIVLLTGPSLPAPVEIAIVLAGTRDGFWRDWSREVVNLRGARFLRLDGTSPMLGWPLTLRPMSSDFDTPGLMTNNADVFTFGAMLVSVRSRKAK